MLYFGDCLSILPSIKTNSVDLILTDLPYGTTACKWDSIIPLEPLWEQYLRIAKDNAAIVLTASQPFTSKLVLSQPDLFRHEWIWVKPQGTNPLNKKHQPLKSHESILVFGKKSPKYYPQMSAGTPYRGFDNPNKKIGEVFGGLESKHRDNPTGERYPKTVLNFGQNRGLHPTQKPLDLMKYLIQTYSEEGDMVLDSCMGSGTTCVAAKMLGRNFIGIEMDEKYFLAAKKRIDETSSYHNNPHISNSELEIILK